jgi:hypothetical protein
MPEWFNHGSRTGNRRAREIVMTDWTKSRPVHEIRAGSMGLAIGKGDGEMPCP